CSETEEQQHDHSPGRGPRHLVEEPAKAGSHYDGRNELARKAQGISHTLHATACPPLIRSLCRRPPRRERVIELAHPAVKIAITPARAGCGTGKGVRALALPWRPGHCDLLFRSIRRRLPASKS